MEKTMADNSNEVMENESDSDDGTMRIIEVARFEIRKDADGNWGVVDQVWPPTTPMQGAATSSTSRPGAATSSTSMQGESTSSTSMQGAATSSTSMQGAAQNEMTGGWSSTDEDETWFEGATRDQNPLCTNKVKSKQKLQNKKLSKDKCRCY
jgi:hypothetical protein